MTKEQFIALGLTEEQATKAATASADELKGFIPKQRFDEVNAAKKKSEEMVTELNNQMDTLKKSTGDNEALKKQIEDLQSQNKQKDEEYQKQIKEEKVNTAIKLAINGKVHDETLVTGLFDKSKLVLNEDGTIIGLDDQVKVLKEQKSFLFKSEEPNQKPGFKVGGDGKQDPPPNSTDNLRSALAEKYKTN
ncbi:phage scaffolding protein [Petroclostridium sp. X23]|uniref:phage scaffolding protein n=1 Tax=Petroclostridium sp. X23 TaxID=3045146 RepID=UPI0024ADC5EE|nr:phage scaffolding protein [Petroclostridium sp. X23]WHH58478.1 phage scaffolding protein [Petroclostridium sp. X23]